MYDSKMEPLNTTDHSAELALPKHTNNPLPEAQQRKIRALIFKEQNDANGMESEMTDVISTRHVIQERLGSGH